MAKEPKYKVFCSIDGEVIFECNTTHAYKDFTIKHLRANNNIIQDCYVKKTHQKKRRKKDDPKSIKELRVEAWDWFSIYIRLRDSDVNGYIKCITCDTVAFWKGEGMQAGHLVPGRNNKVLLHPKIVHGQCKKCNIFLGGNYDEYRKAMLKKGYSEDEIDLFMNMKNETSKRSRGIWEWEIKNWKEKAENEAFQKGLEI